MIAVTGGPTPLSAVQMYVPASGGEISYQGGPHCLVPNSVSKNSYEKLAKGALCPRR